MKQPKKGKKMATPTPDTTRDAYLDGMSRAASTVSLVITDGPSGRTGLTVSAMSSVSADPPILLACVHEQSSAAAAILGNGVFCVNLLRQEQSYLSDLFAGQFKEDKFAAAAWHSGATGAPRLAGALASFDCRLLRAERVATHHVLFGAVAEVEMSTSGNPLVYANRAYGRWSRLQELAA